MVNDAYRLQESLFMMADLVSDNHGNVSCREGDRLFIKPSGMSYQDIGLDDIVEVDIATGKVVDGERKPSVDLVNHLSIYRKHPDVTAICHTHSPYVVAFAMAGRGIMCGCTEQADRFGGAIQCMPFVSDPDRWGESACNYNGLFGPPCDKAALLERHGGVTFSDDPVKAVELAVQMEDLAEKTYMAIQLKRDLMPMGPEDIKTWHKRYNTKYGQ